MVINPSDDLSSYVKENTNNSTFITGGGRGQFKSSDRSDSGPIFTITQEVKVLGSWKNTERGIYNTKEINRVSWNGGTPRIDIRTWFESDMDHVKRAGKGISLTDGEAFGLCQALLSLGYGTPDSQDRDQNINQQYSSQKDMDDIPF